MNNSNQNHSGKVPAEYKQLQLTPSEEALLKECNKEGLYRRAIPWAFFSGLGAYAAAKYGPLMHSKYGTKPAVIGMSILGYVVGRISYIKVCAYRLLQHPDGTMAKTFPDLAAKYLGKTDQDFYTPIDETIKSDSNEWARDSQASAMDIDIPSTNSFDSYSSDYFHESPQDETGQAPPTNYVSYDDLRNQHRQHYTNTRNSEFGQHYPPRSEQFGRRTDVPYDQSTQQRTFSDSF